MGAEGSGFGQGKSMGSAAQKVGMRNRWGKELMEDVGRIGGDRTKEGSVIPVRKLRYSGELSATSQTPSGGLMQH